MTYRVQMCGECGGTGMVTLWDYKSEPCGTCGAAIGAPCLDLAGDPLEFHHIDRLEKGDRRRRTTQATTTDEQEKKGQGA